MDKAKESIKNVLSKSGKHDTTISEHVAPAVQHETVARTEHEKVMPAVDREVHQEHYHTTEQPVRHGEVLPETHHHREAPVETREFKHGKDEHVQRSLADEQSRYKSTHTRVEGDKTQSTEPVVTGEHVHHHVHETIQPVVHKDTVEPHVVHTTVPVHEVHHNEPKHHSANALPAVSMDDFKKQGGSLGGREERHDFFPGEPKNFPGEQGSNGAVGSTIGMDGQGRNPLDSKNASNTHSQGSSGVNTGAASKPGMLDRVNPKKDADGDGKAGVMS